MQTRLNFLRQYTVRFLESSWRFEHFLLGNECIIQVFKYLCDWLKVEIKQVIIEDTVSLKILTTVLITFLK